MLDPRQIGFDDLFIDLLREQQRDVDINALADELADRRQAGLRRRYLNHQVTATNRQQEPPRLDDCRLGAHRQIRRDFETDITISALCCFIDGAKRVRRMLDIFNRESLVERHDIAVALSFDSLQGRIVISTARDGFFKNRGVRGNSAEPIVLNELTEATFRDEPSGEIVEPHGLAVVMQALERIQRGVRFALRCRHVVFPLNFAICSFAAARMFAGVKPNF